jgi:hypothetical protein
MRRRLSQERSHGEGLNTKLALAHKRNDMVNDYLFKYMMALHRGSPIDSRRAAEDRLA